MMAELYLTADAHFGHENIIKYCNRPFKNVEQMDKTIIRNWNSRVKPDDCVIHVGDFLFKNGPRGKKGEGALNKADFYRMQLNGNIIFVKGNHDKHNGVKSPVESMTLFLGGKHLYIIHTPPENISLVPKWTDIVLCGHVHDKWRIKYLGDIPIVNVGCDVWRFFPITINEILQRISKEKK